LHRSRHARRGRSSRVGKYALRRRHLHCRREARAGDGRPRRVRRARYAGLRRVVKNHRQGSSGNLDRRRRSLLEGLMTGREVVDLIKKNAGMPWNERSRRDTFKVGNPDTTVKGIATTMMVTFDMLKRANAAGLNMVIAHEDTYWNDPDDTKDLTENPLYKLKTEYILKNNMVVWRDHDNMHASTPDYTVVGEMRSAGT